MKQLVLKTLVYGNRIYGRTLGRLISSKQYRLPTDLSVEQFLRVLHEQSINYVVLRWHDDLPYVEPGGDLDLLVADDDCVRIKNLLSHSRRGVGCDVYSQSDKGGGLYKKRMAYFCSALADTMLNQKVIYKDYISVPSPANHFHSLAYHAIYQKGLKSGLPTSIEGLSPLGLPAHDYYLVLQQRAETTGIEVSISMEALDEYLDSKGFRPSKESLFKLSKQNIWIRKRFFKDAQ